MTAVPAPIVDPLVAIRINAIFGMAFLRSGHEQSSGDSWSVRGLLLPSILESGLSYTFKRFLLPKLCGWFPIVLQLDGECLLLMQLPLGVIQFGGENIVVLLHSCHILL